MPKSADIAILALPMPETGNRLGTHQSGEKIYRGDLFVGKQKESATPSTIRDAYHPVEYERRRQN